MQFENEPVQRWQRVYESRESLAGMIEQATRTQSSSLRARVREVSRFLRQDGTFESAIVRPDVIAFTVPLLESSGREGLTEGQLVRATQTGLNSIYCQPSSIQRFLQLMIYPALLVVASIAMYLGFALFVAPEFERMFVEFQIQLPSATTSLLASARIVRQFAWLIGLLLCALVLVATLWLLKPGMFMPRLGFLDQVFSNERQKMAELAMHAAQLRSIGLSSSQALAVVTRVSVRSSTRQKAVPFRTDHADSDPIDTSNNIQSPKFALLDYAIRQPTSPENNRMLLEVADGYRRRIVNLSDWWVHWLVFGFQWMIMACISFLVLSIFMPLISIISGLTGG